MLTREIRIGVHMAPHHRPILDAVAQFTKE